MSVKRSESAPAAGVPPRAEGRFSAFEPLRIYPVFRWLWIGMVSANTAFHATGVAIGWLALELTGSALWVGLAAFASGLPLLFLALPVGAIADRADRRKVLLIGQFLTMLVATAFAVLILTDLMTRWLLLALGLSYGCVISLIFPTRQTIVGQVVERRDLMRTVALNAAGQNVTRIFGPALAGVLIAAIGLGGTFTIAALLHVLAMLTTTRLPALRAAQSAAPVRLARSVLDGLAYVRREPVLLSTFLTAAICTIFIMPYTTLMPIFATEELGLGARGLGLLMAGIGVGSVIGTLLVATFRGLPSAPGSQLIAVAAFASLVLLFSQMRVVPLAALLLVVGGIFSAGFLATNQTVLQVRADESMRGRVVALNILSWGLLPLGQLPIGALADALGAPAATAIACLLALTLVGAVALRFPEVRGSAIPE